MIAALCILFFLSGASALLFETLWFRLAGIAFGNSVWASSIVLTSFMGGLALGSGLAARYGRRIRRPLVAYARIEIVIAVTGVLLVLVLPALSVWLLPIFRPVVEQPWLVNPLRLIVGFLLMMVPATAMGLTLPLAVKVLYAGEKDFGRVLGRLYGWNTLGAVVGALAGELALIEWLGLRGTSFVAGGLNLCAAAAAFALASRSGRPAVEEEAAPAARLSGRSVRLLIGSFLAGGILLAFEVVWFRFLQLFVIGTSLAFAIMLATVLAGIALGGLAASWWLRLRPNAHSRLAAVALAAGVVAIGSYMLFSAPAAALGGRSADAVALARLSISLMLPLSLISGLLFTLFGHAAQEQIDLASRTTGLLTLANTVGAMVGAFAGGFLLLPTIGLERSFLLLALAYVAVALCTVGPAGKRGISPVATGLPAAGLLVLLVTFPFGSMRAHLDSASRPYRERTQSETVAVREGLTETIQYLRRDFMGETLHHRLMTNSYSMSGNALDSKRYMKFFVYWPVALHPEPRRALLIGFGAGSTAKALTDTRSLDEIHVVDISRDILDLSRVVFPEGTNPLDDPRLETHVEDGRYFLLTTEHRFDLITAEPPPPVVGGAVNLYTREYFELIRERLNEGGFVSYWLPVTQTKVSTTKSMLAAFCEVFEDCSLWAGSHFDWVMIGSRNAQAPAAAGRFAAQWRDPVVGPEMRLLGLERPEQLGATFIADAVQLQSLIGDALPVIDDRPHRLSTEPAGREDREIYRSWMEPTATRSRFRESEQLRRLWPTEWIESSLPFFEHQPVANMQLFPNDPNQLRILDELLSLELGTAARWMMGSSLVHERIAAERAAVGKADEVRHYLGAHALADGRYEEALRQFSQPAQKWPPLASALRIYSLCRLGRVEEARQVAQLHEKKSGRPLNYSCW